MKGPGLKFYIEIIRTFFCIDVSVIDAIGEIIPVKKWKKKWFNIIYFTGISFIVFFFQVIKCLIAKCTLKFHFKSENCEAQANF